MDRFERPAGGTSFPQQAGRSLTAAPAKHVGGGAVARGARIEPLPRRTRARSLPSRRYPRFPETRRSASHARSPAPSYSMKGTEKCKYCSRHARPGMTYRGQPTLQASGLHDISQSCSRSMRLRALPRFARRATFFWDASRRRRTACPGGRSQREVCHRYANPPGEGRSSSLRCHLRLQHSLC